ncbi:glutathione S-transferase family protein [Burkholderia pseudomultivorans]|uniref:Glutathione S-transferase n=1 Tax=Burkholderia pseudomultivorans TaxID=1207504 RepID=A0A132EDZ1_9BURK|nr:glutathione S-transferase family protein [Burkholderia pseudomultivorans]KWF25749.1 glutathione S-transferase [Burkholderia pseudomultivorans]MDR8730184.1 Stringent starvation protein A [Burkholderia pseudomultivorans]MDR8735409.1 Stringent starvation protein A [Burkholderia pseudomultivorans]MDR8741215.1 Stringent starvation protein A [Burkholderia pseudomultivorans]MDR8755375.1 Stringent starvation protein A [Burkholderia pseudomultivorans]
MKLVIGDKNYSSWSMRPWLLLVHFGIPFDEIAIELRRDDTSARIREYSPSGKVPCLIDDHGATIWDSLAIAETLAERYPHHPMWPADPQARAQARSIAAEMHAGFAALRTQMGMNVRASMPGRGATPEALADVARIDALWSACIEASGGPFLFGEFGIVDAMYAPVVMRFNTYEPALSPEAAGYAARVTALPAVQQWIDAARRETTVIAEYEPTR